MAEPTTTKTKTLTIRVSPDQHKAIRVHVASKGMTVQDYIKRLIEADMKSSKEERT